MWSSPVELYPVHLSSTLSPLGQGMIIEPQVAIREVTERYSVVNLKGVAAYENRNAISTLHWVARC